MEAVSLQQPRCSSSKCLCHLLHHFDEDASTCKQHKPGSWCELLQSKLESSGTIPRNELRLWGLVDLGGRCLRQYLPMELLSYSNVRLGPARTCIWIRPFSGVSDIDRESSQAELTATPTLTGNCFRCEQKRLLDVRAPVAPVDLGMTARPRKSRHNTAYKYMVRGRLEVRRDLHIASCRLSRGKEK